MQVPGSLHTIGPGKWGHPARQDEFSNERENIAIDFVLEFTIRYIQRILASGSGTCK